MTGKRSSFEDSRIDQFLNSEYPEFSQNLIKKFEGTANSNLSLNQMKYRALKNEKNFLKCTKKRKDKSTKKVEKKEKEKEEKRKQNENQVNEKQVEDCEGIENYFNFEEYEEPKEEMSNFNFLNMTLSKMKSTDTKASMGGQNFSTHSESLNNIYAPKSKINMKLLHRKKNKKAKIKNTNSSFNNEVSSLSFIASSNNDIPSFQYFLDFPFQKSEIQSEFETFEFKDSDKQFIPPNSMIGKANQIRSKDEVVNNNSFYPEKIITKEETKNFKKSILNHLAEQVAVLLEWEKTFQNSSHNSKVPPVRQYLTHDFFNISPEFWGFIKSHSRFTFCKANYYLISQYIKYYIWMKCIIEVKNYFFDNSEAKAFHQSVPSKFHTMVEDQHEFINSIIQRFALNSFNKFIINVDLVFAYPIDLDKFNSLNGVDQKKFLNGKFYEEGIEKYRKNITKNNFVNKVYLSLMNEFVIRSIFPETRTVISFEDAIQLPIYQYIANKIANAIFD